MSYSFLLFKILKFDNDSKNAKFMLTKIRCRILKTTEKKH